MSCHTRHQIYMNYPLKNKSFVILRGFTLIEVIIYVALLSMLLFCFMRYIYEISDSNMTIYENISKS